MALYRDFGFMDDAGSQGYAPVGDEPQVIATSTFAGQFIYTIQRELETARIALDRIQYAAERANAFGATDEQLEGLKNSARDVECALAEAIKHLCRNDAADHCADVAREVAA